MVSTYLEFRLMTAKALLIILLPRIVFRSSQEGTMRFGGEIKIDK
jgi:hypothetical protein